MAETNFISPLFKTDNYLGILNEVGFLAYLNNPGKIVMWQHDSVFANPNIKYSSFKHASEFIEASAQQKCITWQNIIDRLRKDGQNRLERFF